MDSHSTADNTTVVGAGPSSAVNRKDLSHHQDDFSKSQSSSQPDKRAANDFVRTVDYTMEGRQFFVPVGHDGLIGALQKLDRELKDVSENFYLTYSASIERLLAVWKEQNPLQEKSDRLDREGGRSWYFRYHQPRWPAENLDQAWAVSRIPP